MSLHGQVSHVDQKVCISQSVPRHGRNAVTALNDDMQRRVIDLVTVVPDNVCVVKLKFHTSSQQCLFVSLAEL